MIAQSSLILHSFLWFIFSQSNDNINKQYKAKGSCRKIFCCHTYTYNNCQWRRTQKANVKYFPEKKRFDPNLKSWMAESTIRVLVSLVYTKSQLHLQQTRPHCVFSLFSFCHCLVSTCSIIVTLTSSVSPTWPELSLFFSGSAHFLLSIVNWMYAILIAPHHSLSFPGIQLKSALLCIQLPLARFGYYQLCLWDHCCNCQVFSCLVPLPISLSLPSRWLCSIFPPCLHNRWNKAKKKHFNS